MPIDFIRARSWAHLNQLLFENSWQDGIKRHRSDYAFRGVTHASYGLHTSLLRLGGKDHPEHGARLERYILRSFKKYAYQDSTQGYREWYWLSVAQHHGLPTRLLDWTTSPLVALHFATDNLAANDEDGAVWCVHINKTHQYLPKKLADLLAEQGAFIFTTELLDQCKITLESLGQAAEEDGDFVLFFEPPSLDARIVNQFGFFSLMPDPTKSMDTWLESHPNLYRKIIIPSLLKWEVRNKLDQMNITERVLFPGLDGLSNWLKRYYSFAPISAENTEDQEWD